MRTSFCHSYAKAVFATSTLEGVLSPAPLYQIKLNHKFPVADLLTAPPPVMKYFMADPNAQRAPWFLVGIEAHDHWQMVGKLVFPSYRRQKQ